MKYVLDTNALSSFMGGDLNVVARVRQLTRDQLRVPEPVFAEMLYGVARLGPSRRQDLFRARYGQARLRFEASPWTIEVTERFAEAKAVLETLGERIEDFDVAIAAHALAEGAILVTNNTKHMNRIPGLMLEDWSKPLDPE